jgi:ankyrin repeat protein
MQKFEDKLNNKIKGLNCICEITNYHREITKQIEDIVDTIYVYISHINNFNKIINDNDNNIPISNIIKRKNKILINNPIPPLNITNSSNTSIDKYLIKFIEMIIENHGDIHTESNLALRVASNNGHLAVVECLISHGADIHAQDDRSVQAASYYGHLAVVECLIKHGADTELCSDSEAIRATPNLGVAADIHVDDDYALRWASMNGHLSVVECLIYHRASDGWRHLGDADIHASNDSALRLASIYGHLAVTECLIKNGAVSATPNLGVAANVHAQNDKSFL